jgi:pimeloyl-ACP methyl ester carboxylesterase
MGKSVSRQPVTRPAQFVDWLCDLLDGLQLRQAHVAGLSMGGNLALRLALSRPDRANKVILMAPAALMPFRPRFFLRMAAMALPSFVLPLETKQRILLGTSATAALPTIRQMLTPSGFRYTMVLPPVYTDADLRQLRVPALLLLGDREVVYDPQAAAKRAARLVSGIRVKIIPGAGHLLTFDQPETINHCILEFLAPTP